MKKSYLIATMVGLIILCLCLGQAVKSQQATAPRVLAPEDQPTLEQLEKTFKLMRLDTQMQTLADAMSTAIQQQLNQSLSRITEEQGKRPLTTEQQEAITEFTHKSMDRALKIYPLEEMLNDIAPIYQRYLSRDDVESLNAFYASPAGQHLLDTQPIIMAEYMPLVMERLSAKTKAMEEELKQDLEKLKQDLEALEASEEDDD